MLYICIKPPSLPIYPSTHLPIYPSIGWIEGAAILFAVLIVAVVTACNNFNKESQFRKLNAKKDDVQVCIIGSSRRVKEK
jgi:hypothetical protein